MPRLAPLALLSLFACNGEDVVEIQLLDANNYTLGGTVDVPSVTTASGVDITVDWSAADDDIQCHDLDPSVDIDAAGLVRFSHLSQADVEAGLVNNSLQQQDADGYVEVYPEGATSTTLSAMSFFGTPIDVPKEYIEGGGTYMLLLTTGQTPGVGARILSFLDPQTSSDVTQADIGPGCGALDLDVDLESLTKVQIANGDSWAMSWSDLTRDGLGNTFDAAGIDELNIGYFADLTPADLEGEFLDVEYVADKLYVLSLLGGTTANLELASWNGEKFGGFTQDGTWVIALRCKRCYNPAPVFFTIVEPVVEEK